MNAKFYFFPVDCGDMTLIELPSGRKILVDCNVRAAADNPDDPTPDVIAMLKKRLKRDQYGRPYVDVFLLSHPDWDHCRGLEKHFHLGPPEDYPKNSDKILILEQWSSPIAFRRASVNHTLSEDAKAFCREAKRRVAKFRQIGGAVGDGDRIQILGEDENGKTADLGPILIKVDELIMKVNGSIDFSFRARLLAPLPKEQEDEETSKNDESVVMQISVDSDGVRDACRFLTGGDAEVLVWEALWQRHRNRVSWLDYDLLLTPHHCSWHSLSHDSWSEKGMAAKVSLAARAALSQARPKAQLIASSKVITDDDSDPPCIRAKREYEDIANDAKGAFLCVMEEVSAKNPQPLEFEATAAGLKRVVSQDEKKAVAPSVFSTGRSEPREVRKDGGGRYA